MHSNSTLTVQHSERGRMSKGKLRQHMKHCRFVNMSFSMSTRRTVVIFHDPLFTRTLPAWICLSFGGLYPTLYDDSLNVYHTVVKLRAARFT